VSHTHAPHARAALLTELAASLTAPDAHPAGRRREHVQALLAHVGRTRLHTLLLRERQHTHTPSDLTGADAECMTSEYHFDAVWMAEALSFGQQLDAAPTALLSHVRAANRMLAAADAQVGAKTLTLALCITLYAALTLSLPNPNLSTAPLSLRLCDVPATASCA